MDNILRYNSQRLYTDLAWLWPVISPAEDYQGEANQFQLAIQQFSRIEPHTLLDLGCGGGHNDHHLQQYFQITGVDTSPAMLALACELNPGVRYITGDMRSLHLEETFDAVIIADAITYMLNEDDLVAAFSTAYHFLRLGGVFCTYAEKISERFEQNGTHTSSYCQGDLEVVMIENQYDPDQADTSYETLFIYLIRRAGNLDIQIDHHQSGLFPLATWQRLLHKVGFEVHQVTFEDEIPFFACVKPGA